jgi:hypothetical protein
MLIYSNDILSTKTHQLHFELYICYRLRSISTNKVSQKQMIKNLRTTPVPPTSSAQPKLNLLFKNYEVDRKEKKRKKEIQT